PKPLPEREIELPVHAVGHMVPDPAPRLAIPEREVDPVGDLGRQQGDERRGRHRHDGEPALPPAVSPRRRPRRSERERPTPPRTARPETARRGPTVSWRRATAPRAAITGTLSCRIAACVAVSPRRARYQMA